MIELQIAITALVIGIFGLIGVNVFYDMNWERVAMVCAIILTACSIIFIVSFMAWIWGL